MNNLLFKGTIAAFVLTFAFSIAERSQRPENYEQCMSEARKTPARASGLTHDAKYCRDTFKTTASPR